MPAVSDNGQGVDAVHVMANGNALDSKPSRALAFAFWIGLFNKTATALLVVLIVIGAGALIRNADNASGLIISAFSVPESVARKGLTGEVLAGKLQDGLIALDRETDSLRASDTYRNSWEDKIQIEIPDTGVSIAEIQQLLRDWLGNQDQVTGSLYETGRGLELAIRIGTQSGIRFAAAEATLDRDVTEAAKAVYRATQPYRYATWLGKNGRSGEALEVYRQIGQSGEPEERAWGYFGYGTFIQIERGDGAALPYRFWSVELAPNNGMMLHNLSTSEWRLGHAEAAFRHRRDLERRMRRLSLAVRREARPQWIRRSHAIYSLMKGDYARAARLLRGWKLPMGSVASDLNLPAEAWLGLHQPRRAAQALGGPPPRLPNITHGKLNEAALLSEARLAIALEREDWGGAIREFESARRSFGDWPAGPEIEARRLRPLLAYALLRAGRTAAAIATIRATPWKDCYRCVLMRARMAERLGRPDRADWWFAEAVRQAPSLAFAEAQWASVRLARRDYRGAADLARAAHGKAPRWADPLKYLGDALAGQNRLVEANARYAGAARLAPGWRSLHLAQARVLGRLGRNSQAAAAAKRARAMEWAAS